MSVTHNLKNHTWKVHTTFDAGEEWGIGRKWKILCISQVKTGGNWDRHFEIDSRYYGQPSKHRVSPVTGNRQLFFFRPMHCQTFTIDVHVYIYCYRNTQSHWYSWHCLCLLFFLPNHLHVWCFDSSARLWFYAWYCTTSWHWFQCEYCMYLHPLVHKVILIILDLATST